MFTTPSVPQQNEAYDYGGSRQDPGHAYTLLGGGNSAADDGGARDRRAHAAVRWARVEDCLVRRSAADGAGSAAWGPVRVRVDQPVQGHRVAATEVPAKILSGGQREPRHPVGVTCSVEECERVERALRESESRFRTLIDKAPVAIGVSRAGTTIAVNEAYLRMFGFDTDADLVGHSLAEQIAPRRRRQVLGLSQRRARSLPAPIAYETVGCRRDGSQFPMHVAIAEVELPDGPATVGFLTDMTLLQQALSDLAFEARLESAMVEALQRLQPKATAEQAAEALCDAMWTLPGVCFVAVFGFSFPDQITALAYRAPSDFPRAPSKDMRTGLLHDRAARGPHGEYWAGCPEGGTWETALTEMDLRAAAYAPIVHGDHADGLLMVGTSDPDLGRMFVERLTVVVDLTSTPSALLADRLHARRVELETRANLERVIQEGAFRTVFQPIVGLPSGEIVGHEALTRFSSGQPPDLCFAEAWQVGIGVELELATLERAIETARALPSGQWLHLNISPRMLAVPEALRATLSRADRPIVLEITEHEAIKDYPAVRDGFRGVVPEARLAVDDAGAGIANFTHIVELRADFVKLDMGLVRGVNTDLGRQALVTGMRHFARAAGCTLVAEGIETGEEADMVRRLGVELGQGYLYGKPGPVAKRRASRRASNGASTRRPAGRLGST